MSPAPHETDRFRNAFTTTVKVRVTVAGGARPSTAERRADKAAERIANAAARLADVVDVTAVAGVEHDDKLLSPKPVRFAAANSGHASYRQPGKLDRYLDPDHERALAAAAQAEREREVLAVADRRRRGAVGCRNAYRWPAPRQVCRCVYCQPDDHWFAVRLAERSGHDPFLALCVCGVGVAVAGGRCDRHRDTELVVLDGDGSALQLLARREQEARS